MSFDLMSIMNDKSRQSAGGERPKYELRKIDIELLYPDPENSKIYSIERIAELADAIDLAGGVFHNLVVRAEDDDGRYQIISGERRWRALIMLVRDRHLPQYSQVNCLVENEHDEDLLQLMLVTANSSTRELTDGEKVNQYQALEKILRHMQGQGKLQGRIRDTAARMLNVSAAQIARYQAIVNNATDELKGALNEGKIGVSAAYEASSLSNQGQKQVADMANAGKADIKSVKEIKQKERAEEEAKKPVQMELDAMPDESPDNDSTPLLDSERIRQQLDKERAVGIKQELKAIERVNLILEQAVEALDKETPSSASYGAHNRLITLIDENKAEANRLREELDSYSL